MNPIITRKIKELIEIAEIEGEKNVQIVLGALIGSILSEDDHLLATKVAEIIKQDLIPSAKRKQQEQRSNLN